MTSNLCVLRSQVLPNFLQEGGGDQASILSWIVRDYTHTYYITSLKMSNKVPVTRLEAFLALKSIGMIGGAESFRALQFSILFYYI